jgi:hypothetical protein
MPRAAWFLRRHWLRPAIDFSTRGVHAGRIEQAPQDKSRAFLTETVKEHICASLGAVFLGWRHPGCASHVTGTLLPWRPQRAFNPLRMVGIVSSSDALPVTAREVLPHGFHTEANDQCEQLKQPTSYQSLRSTSNTSSSTATSFAKSYGPGRHAPAERPPTSRSNGRPGHARSKSQAPRPRTAHGHRQEDLLDPPSDNGTTVSFTNTPRNATAVSTTFSSTNAFPLFSKPPLSTLRGSSLVTRLEQLSLEDNESADVGNQATFHFSQTAPQTPPASATCDGNVDRCGSLNASTLEISALSADPGAP